MGSSHFLQFFYFAIIPFIFPIPSSFTTQFATTICIISAHLTKLSKQKSLKPSSHPTSNVRQDQGDGHTTEPFCALDCSVQRETAWGCLMERTLHLWGEDLRGKRSGLMFNSQFHLPRIRAITVPGPTWATVATMTTAPP